MSNIEEQATIDTTSTTTTPSNAKQLLEELVIESNDIHQQYKAWNFKIKRLSKEMDREVKRIAKSKPKRIVKQKPQLVTNDMQKFMATNIGETSDSYTRQVMMKCVSSYIKKHDLQNQANRKQWKGDKTIQKLFGLEDDWYTFMQINGLLTRVINKV